MKPPRSWSKADREMLAKCLLEFFQKVKPPVVLREVESATGVSIAVLSDFRRHKKPIEDWAADRIFQFLCLEAMSKTITSARLDKLIQKRNQKKEQCDGGAEKRKTV